MTDGKVSRRTFLQTSAATAATAVAPLSEGALAQAHTPGFDHLVVLMFENRSFDNLLGFLHPPGRLPNGDHFDGVAAGSHANPSPSGPVPVHAYRGSTDAIMQSPSPDPGEEYPHVNTQLFGIVNPPSNAGVSADRMIAPFNAPAPGAKADMQGFVADYINAFRTEKGRVPQHDEYAVAMGCFAPDMLPVVSTLAHSFAIYDHWFCGVPSQTFCNRSFFHASTSSGFVTNNFGPDGYLKWEANVAPTIFNRLQDAGISWAVYFDESQIISFTGLIHIAMLQRYWKTNFFPMSRFYADAAEGKLPAYAFIEPRMIFNHNDMHPPVQAFDFTEPDGRKIRVGPTSDVRAGEKLLHDVYSAIRGSASPQGSNAVNTLFLVTFDEHGGTFDHVPPPPAPSPGPVADPEMGFAFDRLGVRVPTIAISAFTRSGSIINEEMHHGAVIATLCRKYGLPPLTARDHGARDITNALNLARARAPADWPITTSPYVPPSRDAIGPFTAGEARLPLTAPAKAALGMLVKKFGLPTDAVPETFGQAYEALQRVGKGLFGA